MHLLATRKHTPSAPYGDGYGSFSSQALTQSGTVEGVEPLPTYQQYDGQYLQPFPQYGHSQAQSQQPRSPYDAYPYPTQPTPGASTSTLDLGWPQSAGAWGGEQVWANSAHPAGPRTMGDNNGGMAQRMNQGAAFCDKVAARLNEMFSGMEADRQDDDDLAARFRDLKLWAEEDDMEKHTPAPRPKQRARRNSGGNSLLSFKKTWLYQNSRLPPVMLPFVVYMPTWVLASRAARASLDAYNRPVRGQRRGYVAADPKTGTKAHMVLEQPVDDRRLLVVAIRGSQRNLVDWHVNFALAPTPPVGFLDDEGNACHAGFLQVARAMIAPVAAQLRQLIQEDPSSRGSSLMFTGHSAGGAVASLLYMHMMSRMVESDLTVLTGVFRRIHCFTFGAPPLSLLPLQAPSHGPGSRNLFFSFANEGDLVVRADWPYMKSLARLIAAPTPSTPRPRLRERVSRQKLKDETSPQLSSRAPRWPVPEASLSTAGRMVLLREQPGTTTHAVQAVQLTDEELRGVVFGDVAMHDMTLYKRRIDELALAVISGEGPG